MMAKSERRQQRSRGTGTLFKRAPRGPWIARWFDHTGRRREKSCRTTDKGAGERILAKLVADAALRRDGVIDANKDRFAIENRKPLAGHLQDYVAHCRHIGHAPRHVIQKERHLELLRKSTEASRLSDLTADALERHLRSVRDKGLSARTVNFARQFAVAFMAWCVETGRAESNPLKVVPRLDESKDRRRVRRPLTDDELSRLLAVAEDRGRKAWYLAAALAGLRRGDLCRLRWADIDFTEATITIRDGKAKREDVVPMHAQLADELARLQAERRPLPTARVFPTGVTCRTTQKDFLRAGLAREEIVRDADGEPVMVGKGKRRRPLTEIVCEDDEGRVIDLHAMRTTLGTNLARAGVAPQVAQRIMRHADYRTTLKHYTVLGLSDTAGAIDRLNPISPSREAAVRTGTDDRLVDKGADDPRLYSQQLAGDSVRFGAAACGGEHMTHDPADDRNPLPVRSEATECDATRLHATKRATGLEPATINLEGYKHSAQGTKPQALTGADPAPPTVTPTVATTEVPPGPELAAVIDAWPGLPEAVRAGILAMVRATREGG